MAVTTGKSIGSKVPYIDSKRDSALANAGTLAVTHAEDGAGIREVVCINNADGSQIPKVTPAGSGGVAVVHTSSTVTTITNKSGGALDITVTVLVHGNRITMA